LPVSSELTIANTFLENATVGEPYSAILESNLAGVGSPYLWCAGTIVGAVCTPSGGIAGVNFVTTSPYPFGDPSGPSDDTSADIRGYYEGTPTTAGSVATTIQVADAGNATTPACSATGVGTCPALALTGASAPKVFNSDGFVATLASGATEQGNTLFAFATSSPFASPFDLTLDTNGDPYAARVTPDGNWVYVTEYGPHEVAVVDPIAGTKTTSINVSNTGTSNPEGLAMTPQSFFSAGPIFLHYNAWLTDPTGSTASATVETIQDAEKPSTATSGNTLTVPYANSIETSVDGRRAFVTLATPPGPTNFQVLNITAAPATVVSTGNLSLSADGGVSTSLRTGQVAVDPRGHVAYVAQQIPLTNPQIATVAVNAGGTKYKVGDTLTVVQTGPPSASGGRLQVSAVNGSGAVTGLTVVQGGADYAVANGLATTGGTGAGCTINILAVAPGTFVNVAVVPTNTVGDLYSQVNTIPGNGMGVCNGSGSTGGITTSPDASRLFVLCSLDNTLHVFNISNGDPTAPIAEVAGSPIALPTPVSTITGCNDPVDVKAELTTAASGTRLFVSCQNSDTVVPIDYNTSTDASSISSTVISTDPTQVVTSPPCGNGGSCPQLLDLMPNPPLHITTGGYAPTLPLALPSASTTSSYSYYIVAQGGTVPRTFTETTATPVLGLTTGACAGLSLSAKGLISGTPTTSGTCGPFTIRVTDSSTPGQFVERAFTIPIS
jgi:hypothetical protein